MESIEFHPWLLHYDYDATKTAYNNIKEGDAVRCGCANCKNYISTRDSAFPDSIKDLLLKIGIDYSKEFEVYHNCRLSSGRHDYGGIFHFIGKSTLLENIDIDADNCSTLLTDNSDAKALEINDSFSVSMINVENNYMHNAFAGKKIVEINFFIKAPWVITEKEPM